jgi:ABC-type antimicrobial peptide transport system permease subunit
MEMKNVFICLCVILALFAFAIGLVSGFVIVKVEDRLTEGNRTNLLILYNIGE